VKVKSGAMSINTLLPSVCVCFGCKNTIQLKAYGHSILSKSGVL